MNQYRIAHGVVVNNDRIHVIGGSASAGDVGSFGVGVKGLEVMDINDKGKNDIYSKTVFRFTMQPKSSISNIFFVFL